MGVHRLSLAVVGPPLGPRFARPRDHRVQEDQEINPDQPAYQWRAEAGERLGDEDHTRSIPDGVDDRIGVLGPSRGIIARLERDRYDVVGSSAHLWNDQMPVPGVAPRARDEHVRRRRHVSLLPYPRYDERRKSDSSPSPSADRGDLVNSIARDARREGVHRPRGP